MKITQIRENGDTEALSVTDIDLLIEKNEKRNQAPPGNRITSGPAFCSTRRALFPRQQTTTSDSRSSLRASERSETNENLQWHCRTDHRPASRKDRSGNRETKGSRTSPNNAGFYGASGKSVKIWTCFTRPDGTLPQTTEEAEVFQAHAYRLAIKCYQPQLPFNILLKEPKLEQFSRLSYDPDLIYRPTPVPFYLSQPIGMPGEMTYHEKSSTEASPLNRALPGMTRKIQ